jgi:AcrR family transcriptional regulator
MTYIEPPEENSDEPARVGDVRSRFIEATERLLTERGVNRVTTRLIAHEAGLSEGALFHYFRTKNELIYAAILNRSATFKATLVVPGHGDVRTNLIRACVNLIDFYRTAMPLVVSIFADTEIGAHHRASVGERRTGAHKMVDLLAAYLEAEQLLGRVRPSMDLTMAGPALVSPCFHWVFVAQATGVPLIAGIDDSEYVGRLVDTVWAGLAP